MTHAILKGIVNSERRITLKAWRFSVDINLRLLYVSYIILNFEEFQENFRNEDKVSQSQMKNNRLVFLTH